MARVYGTIESLTALKQELENQGVTRFSSVKEIELFVSNFHKEKYKILTDAADALDKEYKHRSERLAQHLQQQAERINTETARIHKQLIDLQTTIDALHNGQGNVLMKLVNAVKRYSLKAQRQYYLKNQTKLINTAAADLNDQIAQDQSFIRAYETDKNQLVTTRSKSAIDQIDHTLEVIKRSRNLITGAKGEALVVKEIEKLPDDFVLINNFQLSFSEPIYYRKYNRRIALIQIDHLLISRAGIFIIETKNWSQTSVDALSLRSPIEQIECANFALYRYVSRHIDINDHHWGEQEIPIRNLIVMIRHKPAARFKYVSVKLISELNPYLQYFEPVLTHGQLNSIANKLVYY